MDLGNDSIYVYGTFGQELTKNLINQKAIQYAYNAPRKVMYLNALRSKGTEYAFDCVGLIKSYLWGGYGKVKYNAKQDVSANGMLNVAKKKGSIKTLPEVEGILVQMDGHIGIYIGGGYVIECTPNRTFAKQNHHAGGVCKTKLSARRWTSWCECPWITYETEKQPKAKTTTDSKKTYSGTYPSLGKKGYLSKGDTGENVKKLQKFLKWCIGEKLEVDGSFGAKTEKAVKKYQKEYKLTVDGMFGPASLKKAKTIKK